MATKAQANSTANTAQTSSNEPVVSGGLQLRYQKKEESEVYAVKFSVDDEYLAVGCGDATVRMYQARTGNPLHILFDTTANSKLPCTSITFRPNTSNQNRTKNVLIATYADGMVRHWHSTSGKKLSELSEGENQVFTSDYYNDGSRFVTAGSDYMLRVYDEATQERLVSLYAGKGEVTAGHSNRIFCAKFHPRDPNLIVSGGWDNTVQVWDMRSQCSVRSIYRPHICGEGIDFDDTGDRILTGAYLKENPLQIWQFGTGNLMETIPWSLSDERKPCLLYAAQFSHGRTTNKYIAAGGGGIANELKIFNPAFKKNQCFGMVSGFSNAVYTLHMTRNELFMAVGAGSRFLYVYDIENVTANSDFVY